MEPPPRRDRQGEDLAESPPSPVSNGGAGDYTGGRGSTDGTPRWVKAFGIVALLALLLVVILLVAGGGRHGPGRHAWFDEARGQALPASVTALGGAGAHKSRAGGHAP